MASAVSAPRSTPYASSAAPTASKVDVRPWPRLGLRAMLKSPENSEAPAAALSTPTVEPLGESLASIDHLLQLLATQAGLPAYGVLSMPWRITLR